MQAWSRADMLGNQSCFMNALLICLEEEEEKVTSFTLFYLIMCYYYYHYSLFLFDYLNKYSLFFIDRIILILPSLIEKMASTIFTIRLHLHQFSKLALPIQIVYYLQA
jgi:hypothetical protein